MSQEQGGIVTDALAERITSRAERALFVMQDDGATFRVHPAAAVFPMLADDELRELAADIAANGLHHDIALDSEGRIVDGRNRYAACRIAGVEPTFVTVPPDTDVLAYILSENIRRRHLTKGQQAMAIAELLTLEEGKRTGARARTLESNVSEGHVSQATTIRRYASDLAPKVLAGTEPFDSAYQVARTRKRQHDDEQAAAEREANTDRIELERLRRVAPDIAADVPHRLSVREAVALHASRESAAREQRISMASSGERAYLFFDPGSRATPAERAVEIAAFLDPAAIPTRPDFSPERTERIGRTVLALAALLREAEESPRGHAARR